METITQWTGRHEMLFAHLKALGDEPSDARKKIWLVQCVLSATGAQGPYIIEINESQGPAYTYEGAKTLFVTKEQSVIALNKAKNNKAGSENAAPLNDKEWKPYDGVLRYSKLHKKEIWVYDEDAAKSYTNPDTYSANLVQAKGKAAEGPTDKPKSNKDRYRKDGNRSQKARTPCPVCKRGKHFARDCTNAYKCPNATCTNWHHLKGEPCDGGKAKREYQASKFGKKPGQAAEVAMSAAAVTTGALPKVPDATAAIAQLPVPAMGFLAESQAATTRLMAQTERRLARLESATKKHRSSTRYESSDDDSEWEDLS